MAILGKILYEIGVVFGGFAVICTIVVVLLIVSELAGAQPSSAAEENKSATEGTSTPPRETRVGNPGGCSPNGSKREKP